MKRNAGQLEIRAIVRLAAILLVLFAIGAGGAILFVRMRGNTELAASSPMAAAPEAPAPSAVFSPPPANAIAANPMSGIGAPPMRSSVQMPAAQPMAQPTHAQENELHIPRQTPPSSGSLTLPAQSMVDAARSRDATNYLHSHRLPFVTAKVYRDAKGAPAFLMLAGNVATEFGKADAERKVRDFLGVPDLALANQIQINPGIGTGNNPAPKQGGELKLPSVFKGCWELVNDRQDGPVHLLPGARTGCVYTQDSGRFCYQRTAAGEYAPTFSSLRLKAGLYGHQADEWSRVELLSTDGVAAMRMRFLLHHSDSAGVLPFGFSSREAIDETHELSCRVSGDTMYCEDRELGNLGGQPWCEAMHSDEFRRVVN
jgi:hypothetical protein